MAKYFNKYSKDLKNLCSPAFIYLLISVLAFFFEGAISQIYPRYLLQI